MKGRDLPNIPRTRSPVFANSSRRTAEKNLHTILNILKKKKATSHTVGSKPPTPLPRCFKTFFFQPFFPKPESMS
jgi:hypothetical protein